MLPLKIIQGYDLSDNILENALYIVVDTLRASTTLTTLMSSYPKSVFVTIEVTDAFELGKRLKPCLLVGERNGIKMEGFHYGNSPYDVAYKDFHKYNIIFTSTSGGKWINKYSKFGNVLVGAWINISSCIEAILSYIDIVNCTEIVIVPAGHSSHSSLYNPEDWIVSIFISQILTENESKFQKPEIISKFQKELIFDLDDRRISSLIYNSPNGQYLRGLGYIKDVEWSATKDLFSEVPLVEKQTQKIPKLTCFTD